MSMWMCAGFSALEIGFWCVHTTFISYAAAYLMSRGTSGTVMSLMLSSYLLSAFFGSLFWGKICDRYSTNRKPFIISMSVSAVLICALYFLADYPALVAVIYPLLGFFYQTQSTNADAWLIAACKKDQHTFGWIRAMPSLACTFVCVTFGWLIESFGYQFMLFGGLFFMALTLLTAFLLPDVRIKRTDEPQKVKAGGALSVFSDPTYSMLIALLFLIGIAVAPITNLKIVIFENVGGSVRHIGIDTSVSALTQVPLFIFSFMTQRLAIRYRFRLISIFPFCMLLLTWLAVSPGMVITGSFLYNIGYGIMLPTMRDVTENHVKKELRNFGHNLSDAVFNSFSGIISLIYAGAVSDRFGTGAMLCICLLISSIPVILSLIYKEKAAGA